MQIDVKAEITINRPIREVSEFAEDPDNVPEWYVNIKSVKWESDPPVQMGSRIAFVARFLGRDLAYTYEVAEYSPGSRMIMRTAEGPFPMETTYEFESLNENSTRVSLRNRGEPKGFSALFAPFMSVMIKRANWKDLKLLKKILEGRQIVEHNELNE